MKGRLEHDMRNRNNTQQLLSTMPSYVTDFYYNLQSSTEPSTRLEYIKKIKNFLDFANIDVNNIDDTIVGRYFEKINYTNDRVHGQRQTSFSYRQMCWSVLNQFFDYLEKKEVIDKNPVRETNRPKNKDEVKRISLDIEDLNAILKAVRTGAGTSTARARQEKWKERDLLIMFLFMNTGMRKTALSEINLEDISFSDKKLTVIDKRNTKQIYTINEEMEAAIKTWLKKREKLLNGIQCDALFISSQKQRMCEKAIYDLVRKYSNQALGFKISPHKLRSAFVTIYYEASGHDIEATCKAVGHKDVSITSRYIVKENDARDSAINFMSKNLKFN